MTALLMIAHVKSGAYFLASDEAAGFAQAWRLV